jgi:hypothetical protein
MRWEYPAIHAIDWEVNRFPVAENAHIRPKAEMLYP